MILPKHPLMTNNDPEPIMNRIALLAFASLATACLSLAHAQDNEAEKLFRNMEKKLLAAKALEITFEYQIGKQKKARGELLVTQDNQLRLKVVGHFEEKPKAGFELISDGKQIKCKEAKFYVFSNGMPAIEEGGQTDKPTPKQFHTPLCYTLTRGCVWYSIYVMPYLMVGSGETKPDREESRMRVYDFKLMGTEKIGEKDTKVIRHRVGDGSERFDPEVTVWIDAKTSLPLRRSFMMPSQGVRVVEYYADIKLDPKVDAKVFELGK